jgi:hypothetical protein
VTAGWLTTSEKVIKGGENKENLLPFLYDFLKLILEYSDRLVLAYLLLKKIFNSDPAMLPIPRIDDTLVSN